MKKLIVMCLLALTMAVGNGCASMSKTAVAAEGVTVTTVDAGMKGWAIYANSGKATQIQIDQVKNAYNTYYNAQLICEATLEKYVSGSTTNTTDIATANTSVLSAQSALLNLLNQYIK